LVDRVFLTPSSLDVLPQDSFLLVVDAILHLTLAYQLLNVSSLLPLLLFVASEDGSELFVYEIKLFSQLLLLVIFGRDIRGKRL
jgi:hypothetical protein